MGGAWARMKACFSGCSWIPLRLHSGCQCWSSVSGLFAEFTSLAAPLYEAVKLGTEADLSFRETERLGAQLYTVIHDELKQAEDKRRRKAEEQAGHYLEAKTLRFESDNLNYLRLKEEHDGKQEHFRVVSDNQTRAKQRLEESKQREVAGGRPLSGPAQATAPSDGAVAEGD
ncbi:hypothetical protein ACFTAO_20830 [Paenibacillus rhizoplanae]